jgi:transketolase
MNAQINVPTAQRRQLADVLRMLAVDASGDVVGIDRFGESAPGPQAYEALGVTTQAVVARARALVARSALTAA